MVKPILCIGVYLECYCYIVEFIEELRRVRKKIVPIFFIVGPNNNKKHQIIIHCDLWTGTMKKAISFHLFQFAFVVTVKAHEKG